MEQLGGIIMKRDVKSVEKIQIQLNSDKNNGTLHEVQHTYMIISR
jgi:hypothetical protein